MRTIDEIKADIENMHRLSDFEISKGRTLPYGDILKLKDLYDDFRRVITDSVPFDRLEEICKAEREGRLVVLPCGVDLMKIYNELTSVCEGDGVENYTNGYRRGHRNGQVELIRKILNISDGVDHEPEQALKGGASK